MSASVESFTIKNQKQPVGPWPAGCSQYVYKVCIPCRFGFLLSPITTLSLSLARPLFPCFPCLLRILRISADGSGLPSFRRKNCISKLPSFSPPKFSIHFFLLLKILTPLHQILRQILTISRTNVPLFQKKSLPFREDFGERTVRSAWPIPPLPLE